MDKDFYRKNCIDEFEKKYTLEKFEEKLKNIFKIILKIKFDMCGIAGFINFDNNLDLAERANIIQKHRGPDSQKVWYDDFYITYPIKDFL